MVSGGHDSLPAFTDDDSHAWRASSTRPAPPFLTCVLPACLLLCPGPAGRHPFPGVSHVLSLVFFLRGKPPPFLADVTAALLVKTQPVRRGQSRTAQAPTAVALARSKHSRQLSR